VSPNYHQSVQYVIRDRQTGKYLSNRVWTTTWVKLHPVRTEVFTSYRRAHRALQSLKHDHPRKSFDFTIVEVQLCRL
jgi:hypothetical protein